MEKIARCTEDSPSFEATNRTNMPILKTQSPSSFEATDRTNMPNPKNS